MRLHNEEAIRSRTALGNSSHHPIGTAFTACVGMDAALGTERAAIAWGLQAVEDAILAGAELAEVCEVVASVRDSCIAHFVLAEQILRDSGFEGLAEYSAVRREFLRALAAAQGAVEAGEVTAALDVTELLSGFQACIGREAEAGLPVYSGQRAAGLAAAIQ